MPCKSRFAYFPLDNKLFRCKTKPNITSMAIPQPSFINLSLMHRAEVLYIRETFLPLKKEKKQRSKPSELISLWGQSLEMLEPLI